MTDETFKNIFIPLSGECENYLKRISQDSDTVADAIQDTYLSLWTQRRKMKTPDNPKGFLFRCARNKLYDKLNKTLKEDLRNIEIKTTLHTTHNTHNNLEEREIHNTIKHLIETLPAPIKEVVHLRDINELEYNEICDLTGLSYANVRVCISRGRKLLQKAITNWYKMDYHELG